MKYPKYLENKKSEIARIVSSWPVDKSLEEVMVWLLQFDSSDYDLAIRILSQMNVIGANDLNNALAISYSKLLRHANERKVKINKENTIYVPFGSAGKSGAMIAYNFRLINGLNSAYFLSKDTVNFIKEGKIDNLVLIDDIIASGEQSSSQVKEIAEKAFGLGISNIFVITAIGFKDGINKLSETEMVEVFSAIEYDLSDTVRSMDSEYYSGLPFETRKSYLDRLVNKYRGCGYKGIGALLSFYYNTPNCTLDEVWNTKDGWLPLFPRKHDLNNKAPELYEFDELLSINDKKAVSKNEMSIYVEGKAEELFISELASHNDNFGVDQLKVISIGPFYQKKLLDELMQYSEKTLFITDEKDDDSQHNKNIKATLDGKPLLRIKQIMSYFDKQKIKDDPSFSSVLDGELFDEGIDEEAQNALIETKLLKKAAANFRYKNMLELLDKCPNEERLNDLIEKIKTQTENNNKD